MDTWNCKKCDMPVRTSYNQKTMTCPHCNGSMFLVV